MALAQRLRRAYRAAGNILRLVAAEGAGVILDIGRGILWLVAVVALACIVYVLGVLVVEGQVALPW